MADARRRLKPDMDHEVHGEATEKLDPSMATEELPEAPVPTGIRGPGRGGLGNMS